MVKKVFSYFNKELKFYEGIKLVEDQSNDNIIRSCKRYLQMCPIKEAMPCAGRTIYLIGEFDDDNVETPLISYKEPIVIVDCDSILQTRFPSLYERDETENN